ncbi:response regulator [Rhabdothermincola sp.]|uniref:response regulator n=1 Tax=Rhabdothermincola sp. TaxID=2820405 RepID=UPI002FE1F6AD
MGDDSESDIADEGADSALMTTTVVLALPDAHQRAALADAVAARPDLQLVGEAGTGRDALERITAMVPDVALIDVRLPDPDGMDVCAQVSESLPAVRLLLTAPTDDDTDGGFHAGAIGCVVLEADLADRVVDALRRVGWGEALPSRRWAQQALAELEALSTETAGPVPPPSLTEDEQEVLAGLAGGSAPEEIAGRRRVPVRHVNLQAASAIAKLRRYRRDRHRGDGAGQVGQPS